MQQQGPAKEMQQKNAYMQKKGRDVFDIVYTMKIIIMKNKPCVKNKPCTKLGSVKNVAKSNCKTGEGQPLLYRNMSMNSTRENAEPLQYPSWRNCELPTNVARKSAERPQDLPL